MGSWGCGRDGVRWLVVVVSQRCTKESGEVGGKKNGWWEKESLACMMLRRACQRTDHHRHPETGDRHYFYGRVPGHEIGLCTSYRCATYDPAWLSGLACLSSLLLLSREFKSH